MKSLELHLCGKVREVTDGLTCSQRFRDCPFMHVESAFQQKPERE